MENRWNIRSIIENWSFCNKTMCMKKKRTTIKNYFKIWKIATKMLAPNIFLPYTLESWVQKSYNIEGRLYDEENNMVIFNKLNKLNEQANLIKPRQKGGKFINLRTSNTYI